MTRDTDLDLICLGEPMVEFNAQPDGRWLYGFGGDVSNVAVAAARQGAKVGMATRVGADSFGDDLMALWTKEGVNGAAVARDGDAPTGVYFVRHGPEGHVFEYRRAGSAASRMTPGTLPRGAIAAARCLHFSGISQAISADACAACDAAVEVARAEGRMVSFDPNLRLNLWSLDEAREVVHRTAARADVFLPGDDDARRLTGVDDPLRIVEFYLDLGAGLVALTLGPDGALIGDASGVTAVPAPKIDPVDASGAGDCFDGAFLARLLAGDPALEAATYAVTAAALSVEAYGAVAGIPKAESVRRRLSVNAL
ncbi:MAG: sugar kinase [Pseudomonadota bacterium]